VKSNDAKNRASRVALPLTNCAVTAPAQTIAVISHRDFTSNTPPFRWRSGCNYVERHEMRNRTRPGDRLGDRLGDRPGDRLGDRPGDRLGDSPRDRPQAEAGKAEVLWLKAPEDSWL
jgi:hypothetical protein